jgi:hypothetical protein
VLCEGDIESVPGDSPHYIGLFETLKLARKLLLSVPAEVAIIAVEAADIFTLGGEMHPGVQASIPAVVDFVRLVTNEFASAEPGSTPKLADAVDRALQIVPLDFGGVRFVTIPERTAR